MTFRRRHRWFRRFALGLAFATFAAPAAARPDESGGGSGLVKEHAAVTAGAIQDPYLTDAFVRQGESLGGPDGGAQLSSGGAGVRPDDRADRFAHSDVTPPHAEPAGSGSSVEWDGALTVGIGAVVLALALGLALGYIRRPRLAGF